MDQIYYSSDLYNDSNNSLQKNYLTMVGLSKSGYLEVKQPSNIKGRKLKSWKRKWVVVHKMTDLAAKTFAAKFLLFNDEESSKQTTSDKQAFIYDHVTAVESAKSKTRPLAFQIVQEAPALMLSGMSEKDTNDWMSSLKELFWPEENKPPGDSFKVTVEQNDDAKTWSLYGDYWLSVSPEIISIKSFEDNSIHEWNLNFIKRFFMDKNDVNILIIETGSISEFGEANFRFKSTSVPEILAVIKRNIQLAVKIRSKSINSNSESCAVVQSNPSASKTKQSFQSFLQMSNETQNNNRMSVSPVDSFLRTRTNSGNSLNSYSTDEYNSLDNSVASRESETQIVSKVTVSKDDGQDIQVNIDRLGYSHIQQVEAEKNIETKPRSVSGCITQDDRVTRSTSMCSCDSGFVQSVSVSESNVDETFQRKHKANNSFDSGVSIKPEVSASISGVFMMTENNSQPIDIFVPYSKVNEEISTMEQTKRMNRKISDNGTYASIYWDLDIGESSEQSDTIKQENLYEDLDKYRKNLSKHLGFDPKINPTEVPPSLPDRPATLPTRRKERSKSTKRKERKITLQEMFKTVARGRAGSVSSSSSSTSECDEDKLSTPSVKQWPLANTAVLGGNELYTAVPDEGVFSSGRPRARSCEEKPSKKFDTLDSSLVSCTTWSVALAGKSGLNNTVGESIYSQVYRKTKDITNQNGIPLRRSLRRSNSSVDLMIQEKNRLRQCATDLLTGDPSIDSIVSNEILTPVSITREEPDFIDFSTEISVPSFADKSNTDSIDNSENVWNPFPKIADFTSNMPELAQSSDNLIELYKEDPFDIFRIGFVSSHLCLSAETSGQNSESFAEISDLDKTIYCPNEEIYMDMGNRTLSQQEQTVEYVLPTDVKRT